VPAASLYVGVYDPVSGTYTQRPAHGEGAGAFAGAALLPSGKVALVPNRSIYAGIYDPAAGTYTRGPAASEAVISYIGAALLPSGKVVLVSRDSGYIGIVTPSPLLPADTATCLSAYLNKL
jgi:hypothetical protein